MRKGVQTRLEIIAWSAPLRESCKAEAEPLDTRNIRSCALPPGALCDKIINLGEIGFGPGMDDEFKRHSATGLPLPFVRALIRAKTSFAGAARDGSALYSS